MKHYNGEVKMIMTIQDSVRILGVDKQIYWESLIPKITSIYDLKKRLKETKNLDSIQLVRYKHALCDQDKVTELAGFFSGEMFEAVKKQWKNYLYQTSEYVSHGYQIQTDLLYNMYKMGKITQGSTKSNLENELADLYKNCKDFEKKKQIYKNFGFVDDNKCKTGDNLRALIRMITHDELITEIHNSAT